MNRQSLLKICIFIWSICLSIIIFFSGIINDMVSSLLLPKIFFTPTVSIIYKSPGCYTLSVFHSNDAGRSIADVKVLIDPKGMGKAFAVSDSGIDTINPVTSVPFCLGDFNPGTKKLLTFKLQNVPLPNTQTPLFVNVLSRDRPMITYSTILCSIQLSRKHDLGKGVRMIIPFVIGVTLVFFAIILVKLMQKIENLKKENENLLYELDKLLEKIR